VSALGIPADYGARRGLAPQAEATELVEVASGIDGGSVRLSPAAAAAWEKMRDAASRDGRVLLAISGFRSIERQAEVIRRKLAAGESLQAILLEVAAPGYSEHHTGRAIDIGVPGEPPLTEGFADTEAYGWLDARARGFGFRLSYPRGNAQGFIYEPWHWFYEGDAGR
jgi:D-alanyl-D-alanine carboxypeptidase